MRLTANPKHTGPRTPASSPGAVAPVENPALGPADLARALTTLYVPDDLAELAQSLQQVEVSS